MTPVEVTQGGSPVILAMPHTGTDLPLHVRDALNRTGNALADTDWHIHRLYDGLLPSATTVRATFHRYVIDANRDPAGSSLYPGQNTTGLVPLTDFDGRPIFTTPPDADGIADLIAAYHRPYHEALEDQIARIRDLHGQVILYDCHSIRSRVPFLFDGTLPDINIGTNDGGSCHSDLQSATAAAFPPQAGYSLVINGRFKGGWTTRHYGQPDQRVHAIQMELAQSTYLTTEAPPWTYDAGKARNLRDRLRQALEALDFIGRKHTL